MFIVSLVYGFAGATAFLLFVAAHLTLHPARARATVSHGTGHKDTRATRVTPSIRRAGGSGLAILTLASAPAARAQAPSAHDIVDRAEQALWGRTLQGRLTMTVRTPRWERSLTLDAWMDRPNRTFIRILAPAKEAGIASLRIKSEMWNYLPTVERTIKIPPSMMLQPWMGSDFTNDDLVKESSVVDDYTHRLIGIEPGDVPVYVIEAIPKPDAAVVWGRLVFRIRKSDLLTARVEFYDERNTIVRVLTYSDIKPIGGRVIPTRWEMRPADKPGNVTTIVLERATFDQPVAADIFTQRNLERR